MPKARILAISGWTCYCAWMSAIKFGDIELGVIDTEGRWWIEYYQVSAVHYDEYDKTYFQTIYIHSFWMISSITIIIERESNILKMQEIPLPCTVLKFECIFRFSNMQSGRIYI